MHHVLWAAFFAILAAPLGHWSFSNRRHLILSATCALFLRRKRVRVSCAMLLRIVDSSGRNVLARTYRRPELFGPFGGAVKFLDSATPFLDTLGWEPHSLGVRPGNPLAEC